jgi:hypothetical protein
MIGYAGMNEVYPEYFPKNPQRDIASGLIW